MEAQTLAPQKADFMEVLPISQQLEVMSKEQLINYADTRMGLKVDSSLDPQTIKEELLRIMTAQKNSAREINKQSLDMTMALDKTRKLTAKGWDGRTKNKPFEYKANPAIQVKFFFNQHPGVNEEFANSHPYGMSGEVNKFGFKKCPKYNLFHGETYVLPLLLIRHLEQKIFVTHKTILDPVTNMVLGVTPILKPRFVFQQFVSDEENIILAKLRADKLKEAQNETQEIRK